MDVLPVCGTLGIVPAEPEEGTGSQGSRVTEGWEPRVGVRPWTCTLHESSECSYPLAIVPAPTVGPFETGLTLQVWLNQI